MAPHPWVWGPRESVKKQGEGRGSLSCGSGGRRQAGLALVSPEERELNPGCWGYDTAEDGCTTYYPSYTNQEITTALWSSPAFISFFSLNRIRILAWGQP